MIRVIKNEQYRGGLQIVLLVLFAIVAIAPQMYGPFRSPSGTIGWWPITLLIATMVACMATDVFRRPIAQRALFVVVGVLFYVGATWPLLRWIGTNVVRIDEGNAAMARFSWACMRTWAASFNVVFSLRQSRLMEKPANG